MGKKRDAMKAPRFFDIMAAIFGRKDKKDMAVIYVALIIKGLRTYASVPEKLKPQVKELLEQLDLGKLVTEETTE